DYATGMDELDYIVKLRMMQNLADETLTHRHSSRATAAPVRQYGSFQPGTGTGGAGEHCGAGLGRDLRGARTLLLEGRAVNGRLREGRESEGREGAGRESVRGA